MMRRVLLRSSLLLFAAVLVFAFINRRFIVGMWQYGGQARRGKLKVGDAAPNVTVLELDGQTAQVLGNRVAAKPVVIVFGSFT